MMEWFTLKVIRTLWDHKKYDQDLLGYHELVLNSFLDYNRVLLGVCQLRRVFQIKNDLLPRWQGRRRKLKSQNGDLVTKR